MYLYGASGHGKVVYDIVKACGVEVIAFIDKSPKTEFLGVKVMDEQSFQSAGEKVIISIGDNKTRRILAQKLKASFGKAIHPSAIVASSVQIGSGTVVMHGAIIQADTIIGEHVIINTGSTIDHDCSLGDFVHVGPGANLCGNIQVGECTLIGAGSTVTPGRKIGSNCIVGAGTVIINDIPDGAVVVGNPGRIIKQ